MTAPPDRLGHRAPASASAPPSPSTASTLDVRPRASTGCSARTAPARPRCCASWPRCSPPTTGRLEVLGADPTTAAGRLAVRRRLGYLPQEPGFHRHFSAFDFVDYVAILKEWADRKPAPRRGPPGPHPRRPRRRDAQADRPALRRHAPPGRHRPGAPRPARPPRPRRADRRPRPRAAPALPGAARHRGGRRRPCCCRPTRPTTSPRCASTWSCSSRAGPLHRHTGRSWPRWPTDRVWLAAERDPGADLAWITGEGRVRHIGEPPAGAHLVEPTVEDGYLVLAGHEASDDQSAAS